MAAKNNNNFIVAEAELILAKEREEKAARTKDLGSPIQLAGKALGILIEGNFAWIAENTHVAKKIDLESGKVQRIFRGHTGPVTCLALYGDILLTGSWDMAIRTWNTKTGQCTSTVEEAHTDFVKGLHVVTAAKLLISSGSDKAVRLWDLSGTSPILAGVLTAHTRPVEAIDARIVSPAVIELCTGDTMGVIKLWILEREVGPNTTGVHWRSSLKAEYNHHRTRINELRLGFEQLWTASADDTIQVLSLTSPETTPITLPHPKSVRAILPLSLTDLAEQYLISGAGDVIRIYDVASLEEPEILYEVDAHWHDVTALRLWDRTYTGDDGKPRREPWIISASLDGTLRKWCLQDLISANPLINAPAGINDEGSTTEIPYLTEEEERELAELMD